MRSHMLAVDWSHTKGLVTYDGKKIKVESLRGLVLRIAKIADGGETNGRVHSTNHFQPPFVVLEQGCPLNLIYNIILAGTQVYLIDNHATEQYRREHSIEKSDENDAKIIYELAQNGGQNALQPINLDNKLMQLKDFYHQYCRYQKARIAMQNMKKAHLRQYGGLGDSVDTLPDFLPYDIAIDTLQAREKSLLKKLEATMRDTSLGVQPHNIKGLGKRIWIGLMVTCNPATFKCLSGYLRYCGLTNDAILSHRYSRHAKMLYHMLAEETLKQKDPIFRPIYDKCKQAIADKYPAYTKLHKHNAALNRTATFLAKKIYGASIEKDKNAIDIS